MKQKRSQKRDFNNSGDCRGGEFSTDDSGGGGEYGNRGGRVVVIADSGATDFFLFGFPLCILLFQLCVDFIVQS
jgi:hypothetical protein